MAFDGIVTLAISSELKNKLILGKIEKVYQPEADELVFNVHTKSGNLKLYMTTNPNACRIHLIEKNPVNPPAPLSFCMLLRKHLQGARITDIRQFESERIVEIDFENLNELGFTVSKRIVFEAMGKHSNVVLVDIGTGKIVDAIKHVSIDQSRVRQILPGLIYNYPPKQEKTGFKEKLPETLEELTDGKAILNMVGGISGAFAEELANTKDRANFLKEITEAATLEVEKLEPRVYLDENDTPREFYVVPLKDFEESCQVETFDTVSEMLEFFYENRESTNRAHQKSVNLIHSVNDKLSKLRLKKKKLSEDLLRAENSEELRLFGELLTANISIVKPGAKQVKVTNYYDGSEVVIPLDERYNAAKNAQIYFKRYGKQKTAIKEKQLQLETNEEEIIYLESVLSFLEEAKDVSQVDYIRQELEDTGYLRKRKIPGGFKEKKVKFAPITYKLPNGMIVKVGRNNRENDYLTFKEAKKNDLWLHTKDIPGSHVLLIYDHVTDWDGLDEKSIHMAASIAAFHSKGKSSQNVAVDYALIKNVKKPNGAKPGMVIFRDNGTVYVDPYEPVASEGVLV